MSEPTPIQQDTSFAKTPLQVAVYWAEMGFPVFPCGPDKKPLTPHGFKDATADLDAVADFWQRNPNALVGIPTGKASGLYVVDLDTDRETGKAIGEASFAALGLDHLIEAVPTVATPSGGRHLYFSDSGLASTAGKLGPKVDTRGSGGYIIAAGSASPAGSYRLLTGSFARDVLQDPPDAILKALQAPSGPRRPESRSQFELPPRFDSTSDGKRASMAEVEELLSHIPPDCGYSDWNAVLMGLHDHFDGAAAALHLADTWSARGTKYLHGEVAAKWGSFQAGRGIGFGTVCSIARQNGADLGEIAKRHKGGQETSYRSLLMPPVGFIPDMKQVDVGKRRGRTRWCADIACTILETDAAWNGVLAYDEFTKLYMLLKPIPGTKAPRTTFTPRPILRLNRRSRRSFATLRTANPAVGDGQMASRQIRGILANSSSFKIFVEIASSSRYAFSGGCYVPTANTISVAETTDLLNGSLKSFCEGFQAGQYALWLGSGISRERVVGLDGVLAKLLENLRLRVIGADCEHHRALKKILGLADLSDAERAQIDFNQPVASWPIHEELINRLWGKYSKVLGTEVNGQPFDYLLWDVLDFPTTFAAQKADAEHLAIAMLVLEGAVSDLATANWDGLLEAAMVELGRPNETFRVAVTGDDLRGPLGIGTLYKFHGCAKRAMENEADYRPLLVARETDIIHWAQKLPYTRMREQLRALIARSRTLMIGLSGQDTNIQQLFGANGWVWNADPVPTRGSCRR